MLLLSLAMAAAFPIEAPPEPPREFRAAWVATVDNIDWPSKRTLTTFEARTELLNIIKRADEIGLNALIYQVRPMGDALYKSQHEPWSEFLTGRQGKGPDEDWDPLQFAIEECHKRGIEVHAWFNPYRAWHTSAKGPASGKHISQAKPKLVRTYGDQKWMDPGDPAVQDHSLKVMLDVVKRYDIDGVHIDDYFYPYPSGNTPFPDDATFRAYGNGASKAAWRRQNVDTFVKRLYQGIKQQKRHVKFGISPFGIYRPGVPKGIEAGLDQYAQLYADAKKWLNQGWCDYFTPQLYWSIDSTGQPYGKLLKWWVSENKQGRHMWPGLAAYKMVEGPKWSPQEMVDQVELTRDIDGATGHVYFSVKYLVSNTKGVADELNATYLGRDALVPRSPWLDKEAPAAPVVNSKAGEDGNSWVLNITQRPKDARFVAVAKRDGSGWKPYQVTNLTTYVWIGQEPDAVSVAWVDKAGNMSKPTVVTRP
jgi:uncharacterized lipoprotein YddW (UPF0748 family)